MILIVHNKHDKISREFVENLQTDIEVKIVDFYDYDSSERKYLDSLGVMISNFPTVLDDQNKLTYVKPESLAQALAYFEQVQVSNNNKRFLDETDYKVIRHYEQKLAGITCSMTDEEFAQLMANRQAARNSIQERH